MWPAEKAASRGSHRRFACSPLARLQFRSVPWFHSPHVALRKRDRQRSPEAQVGLFEEATSTEIGHRPLRIPLNRQVRVSTTTIAKVAAGE